MNAEIWLIDRRLFVAPIPRLQLGVHLAPNCLMRDAPQIVGPAEQREKFDKQFGHVEKTRHLRGAIVLRKRVVIVVAALAQRRHRRPHRFYGRNRDIVGSIAEPRCGVAFFVRASNPLTRSAKQRGGIQSN